MYEDENLSHVKNEVKVNYLERTSLKNIFPTCYKSYGSTLFLFLV